MNEDMKYGAKEIEEAELIRFDNRTTHRDYNISFSCPEFTCVCPRSGFPDFATILIDYVPGKHCVELKSLKLYINKFRNQGIYHEDVCNTVMDDLVKLLDPKEMHVTADFTVRGNIHTVVKASHFQDGRAPDYK